MSCLFNFIYLKIKKNSHLEWISKIRNEKKTGIQMINVRAGSWRSQWVQISTSIPGGTAYLRSPKEWFSAAVYFGPERAPACWVWAAVGWLVSAVWLLRIPSLTWNSPHPGLARGRALSVRPAGRLCSLTRLSSALCPASHQMFRCCFLPGLQLLPC